MRQLYFDYTTVCVGLFIKRSFFCCSMSRGRALETEHVCVRACVWQRVYGHVQCWTTELHWNEQALWGLCLWGWALSWFRGPVCDSCSVSVRGEGRHTARGVYTNTHTFFKNSLALTISRQTKTHAYTLTHISKHAWHSVTASGLEPSFTPPNNPEQCTKPSFKKNTAFLYYNIIASYFVHLSFKGSHYWTWWITLRCIHNNYIY